MERTDKNTRLDIIKIFYLHLFSFMSLFLRRQLHKNCNNLKMKKEYTDLNILSKTSVMHCKRTQNARSLVDEFSLLNAIYGDAF